MCPCYRQKSQMTAGTLRYRRKLKMFKTHGQSGLCRIFLPNDESGDKSNHKHASTYLKFMYKFRQLLNFSIAAACSYIVLIWSLANVILKVLGKGGWGILIANWHVKLPSLNLPLIFCFISSFFCIWFIQYLVEDFSNVAGTLNFLFFFPSL